MAKKKAEKVDIQEKYFTLAQNLNEEKQKILHWYIDDTVSRKIKESSKNGYYQIVYKFLDDIRIPFGEIDQDFIEDYLMNYEDSRRNDIIGRLADVISVVNKNSISTHVSAEEIKQLKTPESMIESKNPKKPLSPIEIAQLRHALIVNRKIRYLLTFELVYRYGLNEDELAQCNYANMDGKYTGFSLNGRYIVLPDYLSKYIVENLDDVFNRYNREEANSFRNHFKEMGKYIGRNDLKPTDVSRTQKNYGITCQLCNKVFPPEAKYWAIMRCFSDTDEYESDHIICKLCKEVAENDQN